MNPEKCPYLESDASSLDWPVGNWRQVGFRLAPYFAPHEVNPMRLDESTDLRLPARAATVAYSVRRHFISAKLLMECPVGTRVPVRQASVASFSNGRWR